MTEFQARIKPEHRLRYPGLNAVTWYDVAPLFPGVTHRSKNMKGDRIARLETGRGTVSVLAEHLEFRSTTSAGDPKPAR